MRRVPADRVGPGPFSCRRGGSTGTLDWHFRRRGRGLTVMPTSHSRTSDRELGRGAGRRHAAGRFCLVPPLAPLRNGCAPQWRKALRSPSPSMSMASPATDYRRVTGVSRIRATWRTQKHTQGHDGGRNWEQEDTRGNGGTREDTTYAGFGTVRPRVQIPGPRPILTRV